jgi:hypothetical protein
MEVVCALLEPRERETLGWIVAPDHAISDRILKSAHAVLQRQAPRRILEFKGHALRVRNLAARVAGAEGRSADNPSSLLGEGLDWLVVDEAARIKDEVWNEHLSQRLVERNGWALLLCTPRGKGWFYTAYRRGRAGEHGYAAWTGPTWENPHIEREAIEAEQQRVDEPTFRQEYEGKFVGPGIPQCEVCEYPRPEHPGIALLQDHELLPTCPACGHNLGPDGKALGFDEGCGAGVIEHSIRLLRLRRGSRGPRLARDDEEEGVEDSENYQ